ncbi:MULTISPECIES: MFS transporter [unclassified Aeromicrobium]|uniref:MFS transporter n=1 Tax=unclassified Aeromicrobium TaxID=2633570 RepID=UPI00288A9F2B|nr:MULTISPECIES: MFS transporter [unclassified Aeromicrobium]
MLTTLRRHPTYARLFAAQLSGLLGTGVLTVALALLAADLAGPRAAGVLATALTVKIAAYVVLSPWIARVTAGWAPLRVLVGADVVRVTVALALPLVDATWQVYLLVLVLQASSAGFTPAYQALLPRVLGDEGDYRQALSLSRVAYDAEAVVSPSLAALALLVVDARALFVLAGAGFVGSAVAVLLARPPGAAPPVRDDDRVGGGFVEFLRRSALRRLLLLDLVAACAYAAALVLTPTLVDDVGGAEVGVGVVLAVFGAGSVVGALLVSRAGWLPGRGDPWSTMRLGAVVVAVTLLAGGAAVGSTAGLVVLWALLGLGSSLVLTPSGQVLRAQAEGRTLSVLFAGHFAWSHACYLLTYPLAGLVGVQVSPALALVALGGVALVAAVVVLTPRRAGSEEPVPATQ